MSRGEGAMRRVLAALWLASALAACAPKTRLCVTFRDPVGGPADTVRVTFLGVGGILVRWNGASVMTGPFYSNPTMLELAFSEIHSDVERIDKLLREDVMDARAILIGHSHYDHAMDAPFVALKRAPAADIIGNNALQKILAPIKNDLAAKTPPTKVGSLEDNDPCGGGYEVKGTRFRIRAIHSEHSPQVGPRLLKYFFDIRDVSLWRGEPQHSLEELPTRVGGWAGGRALAFVIDLLEKNSDNVAFRIYYQDSPTRTGCGYPPACLQSRKVDLAILTVGGSSELRKFPGDIIEYMDPQFVMGAHWENFFAPRQIPLPPAKDVREDIWLAPGVSLPSFLRKVRQSQPKGGQASVPCPEETTYFSRSGTVWNIAATEAQWSRPK